MSDYGLLQEVRIVQRGSTLTTAAGIGDTELVVDYAGDFNYDPDDPDNTGGTLDLNGARLAYTSVTFGELPDDPDTLILAAALTVAADADDFVGAVSGGQIGEDWEAHVTMGEGDQVVALLTIDQRAQWPVGVYADPVPVVISDDLRRIEDAPGRTVALRATIWAEDATTASADDTDVPLTLTYTPTPDTLAVFQNGLRLASSEFSLAGLVVTVPPSADVIIRQGDSVSAYYEYDEGAAGVRAVAAPADDFGATIGSLGPLAWWSQGEGSGLTMTDSSGNSHDGTYNPNGGTITVGQPSLVPSAPDETSVEYDGTSSYGSVAYGAWLDVTTIALIAVVSENVSGDHAIVARDHYPGDRVWGFSMHSTGKVEFYLWTSTGLHTLTSTASPAPGDLLGASYDGAHLKIFINGDLDSSLAATGAMISGTHGITVGAVEGGIVGQVIAFMDGRLQHVAIFTSLTDDDMAALATAGGF